MPSHQFESFITELGLRKEIASQLWDANIHMPQELAGMEAHELSKVTNFPLLVNKIHPILQKYVFSISMAKDPYKKALAIVRKHAMEESDEEPMETAAPVSADSTVSDAVPTEHKTGSTRPVNGGPTRSSTQQPFLPKNTASTYGNNGTRMNTTGSNNMNQTHFGFSSGPAKKPLGSGNSISISGGNFVQANILGTGPVTYNNTNTVINTSSVPDFDLKKRRARFMNDSFYLNGTVVRAGDLHWMANDDFWINDITVPSADIETFTQHAALDDVYEVRSHGSSRALILNNINFTGQGMSSRTGADMDCRRMQELLTKLGFQVNRQNNKTAAEMKVLLQDFAKCPDNRKADMAVVYIGSHGERDIHGNDTFVGVDGGRIKFSDVRVMFSPSNSPLLNKKPKMFFLQFCRQDNGRNPLSAADPMQTARYIASDAGGFVDDPAKPRQEEMVAMEETRPMDMLFVYATLAGSKAYRDTQDGSWFVTALVRIFSESAHKEDLLSMLTKVNNSVSTNKGMENETTALQISEVVNTLRKKVFFYPGLDK